MTKAIKRSVYSFSLKKTDNPIIKEFIKEQNNFSETIRYLIIKYCMENGIEDVSSKLNELMYSVAYSNSPKNNSNSEEKVIKKVEMNNSADEISIDLDKENKEDIPECYQ